MEESDAIVVAHKWLIEGEKKGPKLTMEDVEDVIVSFGLKSLPKENIRLWLALIHLGNELVSQNWVHKDGGIRPMTLYLAFSLMFLFCKYWLFNYSTHSEISDYSYIISSFHCNY